jgi:hypothetical protein
MDWDPDTVARVAEDIIKAARRIIAKHDELVGLNAMASVGFGIMAGALNFKPEIAADFNDAMRLLKVPWQLIPCEAMLQ